MERYDVVTIGAGPAGIFAADELARNSHLRIALVEKGLDLPERVAIRSGRRDDQDDEGEQASSHDYAPREV